jgi:integral membrane protein (TIGR01906 family)
MGPGRVTGRRILASAGAVLETAVIATAFTALLLGVTVGIVAAPGVTAYLGRANETWRYTGMTPQATVALADKTRQWVTGDLYGDEAARRPAALGAFKADELSHLDDVRSVMSGARTATGLAAAVLAVWLIVGLILRRWAAIRRGVFWGGVLAIVLVGVAGLAAFTDFSAVFTVFHGLFFAAGTWEFPSDSLLIRVFPGSFWMAAGALWGGLTILAGAFLVAGALTLPRDDAQAQLVSQTYSDRRARREELAASRDK